MRIAIFSRPGACFPNVISLGLSGMLDELGVENKIFYDSIPMLMRLLPFSKKPKRWHNNWHYRIRKKLANHWRDKALIKEVSTYDAIILSECYPNAFWKNYFAIEELKDVFKKPVISYTESPLDAAPLNKSRLLDNDDYNESIYDFNLFVTDIMEIRAPLCRNQSFIGINIAHNELLKPVQKDFTAVIDFAQPGYETYRQQQINTLQKLGIKTLVLEGRYPIEEIRKIYRNAAIFFLSFPETFGLPIAECLACGTYIFCASSAWPMAWRLDENPQPMASGQLPDCFQVYENETDLETRLLALQQTYEPEKTPQHVFNTFLANYNKFYCGDKGALEEILKELN